MDLDAFRAVLVAPGPAAVVHALGQLDSGRDLVAVASELRTRFPELPAAVAAAAMTQASLRRRARAKFGPVAERLWFTADGLEQATHPAVAAHRAERFTALGAALGRPAAVADLCCGIASDLAALAAGGCLVTGYDVDPLTAAVAAANLRALDIEARVECRDVETLDLPSGCDAAFLDPSRRRGGRRTFDVRAYSPPWPFVAATLDRLPSAVKVAPGIPHEVVPLGVEAEWVSWQGELKEAVLWSRSLATPEVARRATVLPAGVTLTDERDVAADVSGPRRYLYDPDPAVVRAHLVTSVVELTDGALLDPTTAYVTSDRLVATPFATAFEVVAAMPFSLKRLRHLLREREVGSVTIMKRGSAVDVERLRRDLRLTGTRHQVVVLALVAGRHEVLLADRCSGSAGSAGSA